MQPVRDEAGVGAAAERMGRVEEDIGRLLSINCRNHELTSWRFSVW